MASGRWYVTTSFKSFAISCFEFGGLGDVLLHALICSKMQSDSCDAAPHCCVGLSEKTCFPQMRLAQPAGSWRAASEKMARESENEEEMESKRENGKEMKRE